MLVYVSLHEQGAALRVDATGDEHLGQRKGGGPQLGRVVADGEGVEVDHAVNGVGLVLHDDPVAKCAQQVAEVDGARGLDPGEDACHGGSGYRYHHD